MRRWQKWTLWGAAGALAVLILVTLTLFLGSNTGPGRRTIEALVPVFTDGKVSLAGLSGHFPESLRATRITLSDETGVWAVIDNASVDWSPLALIERDVRVSRLEVAHVALSRLPRQHVQSDNSELPVHIYIEALHIAHADIGAALAGRSVAITLSGHLNYFSSHRIETQLVAHQLGGAGNYRVTAAIDATHIAVALRAQEPLHGLIAGLAGVPDIGAIALDANAAGPRAAEKISFALTAGPLQAHGAGHVDLVSRAAEIDFAVDAPTMRPRPDLSWQSLAIEGHASGAFTAPRVRGHVSLLGLRAGTTSLAALMGDAAGQNGNVNFAGQAVGLRVPGSHPELFAAAPIGIEATARLDLPVPHATFALSHPLLSLSGSADFGDDTNVQLTLAAPSLVPFANLAGAAFAGKAILTADIVARKQQLRATLQGAFDLSGETLPARLFGRGGKLALVGSADGNDIRVDSLHVSGGSVTAGGRGTFRQGVLAADWNVALADVSRLTRNLSGALSAQGTVRGRSNDLGVTATAQGRLASRGFAKSPIAFSLIAQHLPQLPTGEVRAEGRFDTAPLRLLATANRMKDGALAVAVKNADWKSLSARADLVLAKTNVLPVGHAVFHLDRLVDLASIVGEPLAGQLDGTLDLTHTNGHIHAKLATTGANLAARGAQAAKLALVGEVDDPTRTPAGTLRLQLDGVAADNVTGKLSATIGLTQKGGRMQAAIAALAENVATRDAQIAKLTVAGQIADPLSAPVVALKFAASGVDAKELAGALDGTIDGPPRALALDLSATAHDRDGRPAQFAGTALLDIQGKHLALNRLDGKYQGETLHLLAPAQLDFASGLAVDHLRLGAGHATLDLAGRVTPTLALTAAADNVSADLVSVFVPDVLDAGIASGTAKLGGTLAAPEGAFALSAHGIELHGTGGSIPPATLDATASLHAGSATLDATVAAGQHVQLSLIGMAPLHAGGNLNLHAKGAVDLAVLDPVLNAEGRSIHGQLTLDATATGAANAPLVSGTASLAKGRIEDFVNGVHVHDVEAAFEGDGDTIAIKQLSAKAGAGTIAGSGTIGLRAPGLPVDLTLTAKNASPVATDQANAVVDANLKLTGHAQGVLNLTGTVAIESGEFNIPDNYPPGVAVLDIRRHGKAPPPAPPTASRVALDLTVSSPGRLFVRGRGLDAEMSGSIRIQGASSRPLVTGAFQMRRGDLSLASQTLSFTSGRIGFDGASVTRGIDPTLDFIAQSYASNVTATLEVTGHVSQPQIKLSSTPALPQDEVLAQLLFQQSMSKLSPFQLAEIAQAIASLSGVGGFNPLANARRKLGLDRLAVGNSDTGSGATVEAGKYVARGIYLGAKQDTSGSTQGQVQIDLTRHFKLLTTLSTQNQPSTTTGVPNTNSQGSSIGLSYQFEY